MSEFRSAAALVAACMAWHCPAQTVDPAEQTVRDSERVRILRAELAHEEAAQAAAARSRAEHLASHNASAALQDEAVQQRATENIAALRREVQAALTPADPETRRAPSRGTSKKTDAPWWDVYAGHPRRSRETASPVVPITRPASTSQSPTRN